MSAYFYIYGLVTVGILICFIENREVRRIAQALYFLAVLATLSIFAGMRSPNVDVDFQNYEGWFWLIQSGDAPLVAWIRDPAFGAISYAVSHAGLSYSVVAFIYAFAGIVATWILALTISLERWATLLFYLLFCQYYVLLDMTEIRAAVAIPLMACSLYLACENRRGQAIAVYLLALIFHFSAIAGLPLLILIFMGVRFRSRIWLLGILVIGITTSIVMRSVINLLSGLYRVSEYLNGGSEQNDLRVISWYALAHLLAIVALSFSWKKLTLHQRMAVVACGIGLMLFLVFGWNTGLATRLLYIFDVYWLLILLTPVERLDGEAQVLYVGILLIVGFALYWKSLHYVGPYSTLNKWDAYLHCAGHIPGLAQFFS